MSNKIKENNIFNDWADFWFYEIRADVISTNTIEKITYENWSESQDISIPDEVHEARKKTGFYNKGIAVITGKSWQHQFKII